MSKRTPETPENSCNRRDFLRQAGAGLSAAVVLGLLPDPVKGSAYAQSEGKIAPEWLELARKYGEPTGAFGKIGSPVTLTIGYQPYGTIHWTAALNKQAELLAKYLPPGSKVVWFRSLSGPLISNNMLAGKNQFGYMSDTPALTVSDKVKCDLVAASAYDVGLFGSLCVPTAMLKEGKVKEPKDLEGQPVVTAFGSFSHRQILNWMEQHGVKPNLQSQSIDQQLASLRGGLARAAALWEPYPSWLEIQGVAERWVTGQDMKSTSDLYLPEADLHTFRDVGAVLAIHDWLRERPDVIAAYLKSEEEARDMLHNAPDLAAYYIWTDISEIPPAAVRATIDMMVWDGRLGANMIQHLKACARMWKKQGLFSGERSQDPDKYVDDWANGKFLDLAMKEMEAEGHWTSNKLAGFPKESRPEQLQRQSWKTHENFKPAEKIWKRTKI